MKKKILNVVSWGLFGYFLANGVYVAVPEIQEILPQYDQLTAVITGGASGLLSGAGLWVSYIIDKGNKQSDEKYLVVAELASKLGEKYNILNAKYEKLENALTQSNEINKSLEIAYNKQLKTLETLISLVKVDLNAKLSNPLIDEHIKEMIEGVLNE